MLQMMYAESDVVIRIEALEASNMLADYPLEKQRARAMASFASRQAALGGSARRRRPAEKSAAS